MPAATKRAALDVVFAVAVLWASAAADSSGRGAADAALAAGSLAALEWRLEHVLEPHLAALPPAAGDLVQWARDLCHQRHQDRKDVAFSVQAGHRLIGEIGRRGRRGGGEGGMER